MSGETGPMVWCADRFPNCVFAAAPPPYVDLWRVPASKCTCRREKDLVAASVIEAIAMHPSHRARRGEA